MLQILVLMENAMVVVQHTSNWIEAPVSLGRQSNTNPDLLLRAGQAQSYKWTGCSYPIIFFLDLRT
jgi:hypothetical protein